jgi:hypothetical protein
VKTNLKLKLHFFLSNRMLRNLTKKLSKSGNLKFINSIGTIKRFNSKDTPKKDLENENKIEENSTEPKKETKFQKLKKYGKIGFVYWTLFYIFTFILLYGLVITNLINVNSAIDFIIENKLASDEEYLRNLQKSQQGPFSYGNLVFVFLLNEILEIARLPVILATLPFIFKRFKK